MKIKILIRSLICVFKNQDKSHNIFEGWKGEITDVFLYQLLTCS